MTLKKRNYILFSFCFASISMGCFGVASSHTKKIIEEPVSACLINTPDHMSTIARLRYQNCLDWVEDDSTPLCHGYYTPISISAVPEGEVRVQADEASLFSEGRSKLSGQVQVQENERMVSANTAYIYRNAKSNQITKIELFGDVRYEEPDRLMLAEKAVLNPQDNSGRVDNVLYRIAKQRARASLPAWGKANYVQRFANQDYLLSEATYSTCSPSDKAWYISAKSIKLDHQESKAIARDATLRFYDVPVFYTPYLSFTMDKKRKTGFLRPVVGYSNVGGFNFGMPYYLNLAPNYDATLLPQIYTRRGLMMGGEFRYLTANSFTSFGGQFLPHDEAFKRFVNDNKDQFPSLRGLSNDRWYGTIYNQTQLNDYMRFHVNYQEVSDDYYLQDFSTNLAVTTQSQILQEADLTFTSDHWLMKGLVQSYQTLHPINQSEVSDIYQRLPHISASGQYDDLPFNSHFDVLMQIDNFQWPSNVTFQPQGPRLHINPNLKTSWYRPWGYITPSIQLVDNNYRVKLRQYQKEHSFNRFIPRYGLDSGLFFERQLSFNNHRITNTLEPRLFYLYVPFKDQTRIPVYDSAYMIFNYDQLFRFNRFSGFDRIGDTNQLAYAVKSRWISDQTGNEIASISIGQARYFNNRRVKLCYDNDGTCQEDPLTLGFLSLDESYSPVALRAKYHFNPTLMVYGDYVWDPATRSTNNGYLSLLYHPGYNKIFSLGYNYLVNGDITQIANTAIQDNVLSQATFAYSWPLSEQWTTLGVFSHNLSKRYNMMSYMGVQYENCCWAVRLIGGRTFQSLSQTNLTPNYNSNVFLQVILKGLGSASSSDPSSIIGTYLPGFDDLFSKN